MGKLIPLIDPVRSHLTLIRGSGAILVICLATTVSMIGHGIITPVLPLFAKEFGVRTAAIGFVVATFGLSRLFMNLPSGMIAERYGVKRLMAIGLMLGALGLIIGPLLLGWISDAFDRRFGNTLGESVAMEFNAILLLALALLLSWVGTETAGRRR